MRHAFAGFHDCTDSSTTQNNVFDSAAPSSNGYQTICYLDGTGTALTCKVWCGTANAEHIGTMVKNGTYYGGDSWTALVQCNDGSGN